MRELEVMKLYGGLAEWRLTVVSRTMPEAVVAALAVN